MKSNSLNKLHKKRVELSCLFVYAGTTHSPPLYLKNTSISRLKLFVNQ